MILRPLPSAWKLTPVASLWTATRGIATAEFALTQKPYSGPGAAGLGGPGPKGWRRTAGWANTLTAMACHSENGPPTHDPAMEAAAHSPQIPVPTMVTGSRLTAPADR